MASGIINNKAKSEVNMKKNKMIGLLLLLLAVLTIFGTVIQSQTFWTAYNYFTFLLSVIGGIALLKQK